ncbi:fimbrial protein [Stenotrophomonas sp. RAC2]|uniref:fimbrial protein n=1 Tax=Stenotrophomonas sp. RAC2 TaxID=3064902 RepID=UPI0027193D93|nr:fimbrial protein [Stenotrophomonas sp. RAC2]MDV9043869.1 fimbrial protein [Stenotrophomonas sp. RAC2]
MNKALLAVITRWQTGPVLLVGAGLMAWSAAAHAGCVAGPQKWMPSAPGYYDSYEEGEIVVGWARATVNYYVDCDPGASADITIGTATGLAGRHDNRFTFRTEHDGIGIQMEYRYIRSDGTRSGWMEPGTASSRVTAYTADIPGNPTSSIPIELDYRFVALRHFSGESIRMGDMEPLRAVDGSYGLSLNQLSVEGVRRSPRVEASCSFSARPPATLRLPETQMSALREAGDMGPAAEFSFSWSCRAGNQGHSGRGDFRFKSTAAVAGTPGQLSTSGTAEGVNMLVTLERKDGSQEPILFDTWYANRLSPGTGGLPVNGSQAMQVRFIRTAKPLVPGTASSTLTIEAIPY